MKFKNYNIFSILFFIISLSINAQQTSVKYYKDEYLQKETSEKKANYSQTIIEEANNVKTFITTNLNSNKVIRSESYKGDEPTGIWIEYQMNNKISFDYSFDLVYSNEKCADTLPDKNITNCFVDNDSIGYKAPVLANNERSIFQIVAKNITFPAKAREEGLQGKVFVAFTISENGTLENFFIRKGAHKLLDKEAIRVIKLAKYTTGATYKGKPIRTCINLPISFKMQ